MFTEPQITAAEVDFGTGPQIEAVSDEIINILLIGQDSAVEGARSDTILLCSFNKEKNTVAMISFLRDMYVRIPGYGKDRINAAYSLGGAELLCKTLYENFGIEVDGNVRVDFARFRDIIDLLGGVKLNLTAAEAACGTEKPMLYLNSILQDYAKKGIRTKEQAEEELRELGLQL